MLISDADGRDRGCAGVRAGAAGAAAARRGRADRLRHGLKHHHARRLERDVRAGVDLGAAVQVRRPRQAAAQADPVWRLPFHDPYEAMIEPGIADLDNAPKGGFAGCITAALFLRRFVSDSPYAHFDIYGWQPAAAPARPKGGVGQATRAVFAALDEILTS